MLGLVAGVTAAVVYEMYALAVGGETISRALRRSLAHPVAGPALLGAAAGLLWHVTQPLPESGWSDERDD